MPSNDANNAERVERIDRITEQYRAKRQLQHVENTKLTDRLVAAVANRKFRGSSDVRAICQVMLEEAIVATEADFGNIQLVSPSDGALRIAAQRGFGRQFLDFFREVTADTSACGEARRTGARVVVANVEASSIYAQPARLQMLDANALACQSTPILSPSGHVLLGIVSTHFRTPHRPTPQQLALVDLIARQAGELLAARR